MPEYSTERIEALIDGEIPWDDAKEMMSSYKDSDRFLKYREILQKRADWEETILLPLTDHLYVVGGDDGRVVKCDCGQEFGDYRENWKHEALINVRDSEDDLQEVYPKAMHSDPDWMVLREFFCPECHRQLEVEAVPPGYPLVFDFQPYIDEFYEEWIGRPAPDNQ